MTCPPEHQGPCVRVSQRVAAVRQNPDNTVAGTRRSHNRQSFIVSVRRRAHSSGLARGEKVVAFTLLLFSQINTFASTTVYFATSVFEELSAAHGSDYQIAVESGDRFQFTAQKVLLGLTLARCPGNF